MTNTTTILYVDDENANVLLFKVNFRNHFNVITATSGEEALILLENNPAISIVISDLRMPKMSGLEFISKAHKQHPLIAYFILSGFEISGEIQHYLKEKIITDYFCKPLDFSKITEKLCSFIPVVK